MGEKTQLKCPPDNYNYNRQREERTFLRVFANSGDNPNRWYTSTRRDFCKPEIADSRDIGRRKDSTRRALQEHALLKIANDLKPREAVDDGDNPSEYFDKFCDPNFTPLMDQPDSLINDALRYPLYACNNHTLYREQIERGGLKSRSEISNLNDPFRRNSTFTTSPDLALREPTGGF